MRQWLPNRCSSAGRTYHCPQSWCDDDASSWKEIRRYAAEEPVTSITHLPLLSLGLVVHTGPGDAPSMSSLVIAGLGISALGFGGGWRREKMDWMRARWSLSDLRTSSAAHDAPLVDLPSHPAAATRWLATGRAALRALRHMQKNPINLPKLPVCVSGGARASEVGWALVRLRRRLLCRPPFHRVGYNSPCAMMERCAPWGSVRDGGWGRRAGRGARVDGGESCQRHVRAGRFGGGAACPPAQPSVRVTVCIRGQMESRVLGLLLSC